MQEPLAKVIIIELLIKVDPVWNHSPMRHGFSGKLHDRCNATIEQVVVCVTVVVEQFSEIDAFATAERSSPSSLLVFVWRRVAALRYI